jgi:hypothetical protein
MLDLIKKLEAAILHRNPQLTERLLPALPVEKIKKQLDRAGVKGAINPVVELYSWHNGTNLQGFDVEAIKAGFVPPLQVKLSEEIKRTLLAMGIKRETDFVTYNFVELEMAILHLKGYKKKIQYLERYFPILWDGSTNWIAVDMQPLTHNGVVTVQWRDKQPVREAYASFEEFLKDAIRANENNEPLTCIRTPGKPITA